MNVWEVLGIGILVVAGFIIALTLLYNLVLMIVAGRISGKTQEKYIKKLEKELPGKDCGACGCETCREYAFAVFSCRMDADKCPEGGPELAEKLNTHMKAFQDHLEDKKEEKETDWDQDLKSSF